MPTLIHRRVQLAREGRNPYVVTRLASGWVVIGDVQPLPGYCLLLPDPVVPDLNALDAAGRTAFLLDMTRLGDARLAVTGAERINYEILGNSEAALHAHVTPRYADEDPVKRRGPAMLGYQWATARTFDPEGDRPLVEAIRATLERA